MLLQNSFNITKCIQVLLFLVKTTKTQVKQYKLKKQVIPSTCQVYFFLNFYCGLIIKLLVIFPPKGTQIVKNLCIFKVRFKRRHCLFSTTSCRWRSKIWFWTCPSHWQKTCGLIRQHGISIKKHEVVPSLLSFILQARFRLLTKKFCCCLITKNKKMVLLPFICKTIRRPLFQFQPSISYV